MSKILSTAIVITFFLSAYGQDTGTDMALSFSDSILLHSFWTKFRHAINEKDKSKLATLCEFPFYCSPCVNDTLIKNKDRSTVKVTKRLFFKSLYVEFFDKPISDLIEKMQNFETAFFQPAFDDKGNRNGFMFSYTIVAPSKSWEGLQGFIYLREKGNQYKITGIDTVP